MKLLFIGDVVGKPGRDALTQRIRQLRQELNIDFVIANGENAAGGAGLTGEIAREMKDAGIDAVTLGDHVWDQRGFAEEIDSLDWVSRPANLPPQSPGRRFLIVTRNDFRLAIITVLGRSFMKIQADCPFRELDSLLRELNGRFDGVLVEVHAEATAEKVALGWYLDGRALLVVGTHTHIPTADACVLPKGTAYHTDAGMTGPYDSVLGREIQPVILRYLDGLPRKWPVAEGDIRICGTLVEFDPESGISLSCRQLTLATNGIIHSGTEDPAS